MITKLNLDALFLLHVCVGVSCRVSVSLAVECKVNMDVFECKESSDLTRRRNQTAKKC